MAIKQSRNELLKMVKHVKTRINAGDSMTKVATEMGIKREQLEYRLLIAGYRMGRTLVPIMPIDAVDGCQLAVDNGGRG